MSITWDSHNVENNQLIDMLVKSLPDKQVIKPEHAANRLKLHKNVPMKLETAFVTLEGAAILLNLPPPERGDQKEPPPYWINWAAFTGVCKRVSFCLMLVAKLRGYKSEKLFIDDILPFEGIQELVHKATEYVIDTFPWLFYWRDPTDNINITALKPNSYYVVQLFLSNHSYLICGQLRVELKRLNRENLNDLTKLKRKTVARSRQLLRHFPFAWTPLNEISPRCMTFDFLKDPDVQLCLRGQSSKGRPAILRSYISIEQTTNAMFKKRLFEWFDIPHSAVVVELLDNLEHPVKKSYLELLDRLYYDARLGHVVFSKRSANHQGPLPCALKNFYHL